MAHRDLHGREVRLNSQCLKTAIRWLFAGIDWSSVQFRGDCSWTPPILATTALLWAWSGESTLVERFETVRKVVLHLFPQPQLAGSYQGFVKMLRRWTLPLVHLLQARLRERQQTELADTWQVFGLIMFAIDGSRTELPRTQSNENSFAASRKTNRRQSTRNRKRKVDRKHVQKSNSPQLWITTMWHVGSGLPWDWRLGPGDSSEREHLLEMLPDLPAEALVTGDAGFVGYEYAAAILASGRKLLIRVGANVKLLKSLGYARESDQTVYLWPDQQARRNEPPLVLRLVVVQGGKAPVYLLTSVPRAQLSDTQVAELYRRRWGIELFYRHLKQTFDRRKLRSMAADNTRFEMHWSLIALWVMALYAEVTRHKSGCPATDRLSMAQTLRAFRRMLRDYLHPSEPGQGLCDELRRATIDSYRRHSKASRNYPRKKRTKPPGAPQIVRASATRRRQAQNLRRTTAEKG